MSLQRNSSADDTHLQTLINWAAWYTARFTVSESRFQMALKRRAGALWGDARHAPPELLARVHAHILSAGLIDDSRFAQGLAVSLLRKGMSRPAMTARLLARGVAPGMARAAVENAYIQAGTDPDLMAALTTARRKAWGPFAIDPEAEKTLKQKQKMGRAGFSSDIVRRVFAMDREQALNILEGRD